MIAKIALALVLTLLVAGCDASRPTAQVRPIDDLGDLGSGQVEALVGLTRVWGFLKYHHPAIAGQLAPPNNGADSLVKSLSSNQMTWTDRKVEWDTEFRASLRPLLFAPDPIEQLEVQVSQWLDKLGDPASCQPCAQVPTDVAQAPDLAWLEDTTLLSASTAKRLKNVYVNRWAGVGQSFARKSSLGNITFVNEESYDIHPVPRDLRLLALARFWNAVEYWYPYRTQLEKGQLALLKEFMPQLWSASDDEAYAKVLVRLAASLKDGHANLVNAFHFQPPGGSSRLPLVLRWLNGQLIVSRVLADTGTGHADVRAGDVIVELDGRAPGTTKGLWEPFFGASNDAALSREIASALANGQPGETSVVIRRDAQIDTVSVGRSMPKRSWGGALHDHELMGPAFRMLTPEVAYLRGSLARAEQVGQYIRAAAGSELLVVDMRSYPSDTAAWLLARHFVDDTIAAALLSGPDIANPGTFTWILTRVISPLEPTYTGRVLVLVDELTQSAAEYSTMLMQASPRVVVVGSQTAGADGNVVRLSLPGGLAVTFSGLGVYYPDRRVTQGVGVHRDLTVHPTIQGLRDGVDEVLEAGVRHVLRRPFRLDTKITQWRYGGDAGSFDCYLTSQC
ncbi:MAG: hypothetical protein K2Y26_05345 [Gemmatimonadaceae bacterium]|nr:hypothetical protein [Gemmatimonadaceae bacterium]